MFSVTSIDQLIAATLRAFRELCDKNASGIEIRAALFLAGDKAASTACPSTMESGWFELTPAMQRTVLVFGWGHLLANEADAMLRFNAARFPNA